MLLGSSPLNQLLRVCAGTFVARASWATVMSLSRKSILRFVASNNFISIHSHATLLTRELGIPREGDKPLAGHLKPCSVGVGGSFGVKLPQSGQQRMMMDLKAWTGGEGGLHSCFVFVSSFLLSGLIGISRDWTFQSWAPNIERLRRLQGLRGLFLLYPCYLGTPIQQENVAASALRIRRG
jgi:hypothetical protein